MLTEDFCSYEVAKLLKEKGFDEPLERFYNDKGKKAISINYNWNRTDDCSCPTHQMAMKWLREKGVYMSIDTVISSSGNIYFNIDTYAEHSGWNHIVDFYASYEEAVDSAIKYSLENLI